MGYGDEQGKYLAGQMAGIAGPSVRNWEVIPNLKAQRQELMTRVEKIDKLLGLFEKNPEFVKILDLTRELI